MNIKPYLPTVPQIVKEGIIVLAGVLLASFVLSRFPALKKIVKDNSLTVNDSQGNNLF